MFGPAGGVGGGSPPQSSTNQRRRRNFLGVFGPFSVEIPGFGGFFAKIHPLVVRHLETRGGGIFARIPTDPL